MLLSLLLGLLLLAGLLELLSVRFGLPHVPAVLAGARGLWRDGTLQHDIEVSSARWLSGWAIGAMVGVSLGLLTGRSRPARVLLQGFLVLCRAVPFISLVPLSIRVFGLAEPGKIFLTAWASAGICWVVVHQAAQALPEHVLWRARTLGVSPGAWILRILIPSCAAGISAALRTSLALGLIVVAVAEMSGVYERSSGYWWSEGLGYRLFRSLDQSRDDLLLSSILCFTLVGIAGDQLFLGMSALLRRMRIALARRAVAGQLALAHQQPSIPGPEWTAPEGLTAVHVTAGYGDKTIIHDLTLTIPAGTTLSLIGPSGCGKTTLVRAIGYFTDETFWVSGKVRAGKEVVENAKCGVGVIFQDAPVFEHLTVWDNVAIGGNVHAAAPRKRAKVVRQLLAEFGLEEHAGQPAASLSGGQRQRLAFAAVLANRPFLLLLDEPFGALDAITRRHLQQFYWQHVHGRVTALLVTHDLEEALLVGDAVRVGTAPDAALLHVDKQGSTPHEWERTNAFIELRRCLLSALESYPSVPLSGMTADKGCNAPQESEGAPASSPEVGR